MAIAGSGTRRRLTTIQKLGDGTSTSGFPIETVVSSFSWYASRQETNGGERFAAQQLSATSESVWQGPYVRDLDPERLEVPKLRRLVYMGRTYDIVRARIVGDSRPLAIELVTLAKAG